MALPALAMAQTRVEMVVLRTADAVEVYFGLPANALEPVFALPPSALTEADGTVDFDGLREGTYLMADDLLAPADARIGGAPARFEGLSMMVHPLADRLPFVDPVGALLATTVCTVPTPETAPRLSDLYAYAGFIAYTDTPRAPISLRLPVTGRGSVTFDVREYGMQGYVGSYSATVPDGETLALMAPDPAPRFAGLGGLLLMVALAGLGALAFRRRRGS